MILNVREINIMKYSSPKKSIRQSQIFLMYAWMLIVLLWSFATAQTQNIQFKHLTTNDGLSHSFVHSICQDKYGFIWIGSDDGLNRFDGNNFHVYKKNIRDKYSISSSNVISVFEDSRGDLWIGTRQGLNLYDRKNDRFIRYPRWSQFVINSIAEDKERNLWIGTSVDLYRYDVKNDSVQEYLPNTLLRDKGYLSGVGILPIMIDSRKNVWIGTSYGLNLYDKEKNLFINYYYDENNPNSLNSNDIRSILEDKSGRIWIGTPVGLNLFTNPKDHPKKSMFVHYQNSSYDQNSISKGAVLSLLEDDKHNLWIGIENGGLDLLDLNTYKKGVNNFVHFKNDPNRGTSLSNNSIYSLFQDKQGNIWIGTFGNGLNILNPIADKFMHFKSEPGSKNSLSNNQVNVFLEENDFLWIGTEGGLNRYNKKDNTFKHYVNDPLNKKSIGSNAVWALCKDKRGNLWIGTWGGGLNRFDYKTESFEHYYNDPRDTNSIGSNNMFSIFEDSRGRLWIGTMGGGLNMFDSKRKIFTRYNISNSGIYTNYVSSIIEAKNGDLWLANETSFERFDRKTKIFEHYVHVDGDSTSLSSNKAISSFADSKGNIWLGTDAGLNLFNESTKGFTCYQIENGLPDNCINSILEDDHGNLWIGTNKGLSKFINAINLPAKPEFKNYSYGDGLQGNEFGRRSCLRGADGTMYFGGTNGFNVFNPDKIIGNTYIPPVVITEFRIFNNPMTIGDKGLKNDADSAEDLILSSKQSVFSLDFSALNYVSSSNNQYAYKMEGFDNAWNYVGTKHTTTYTNLDPGKYIFRVKGSNNDGVWNEKGIALPIVITPTFWQTLWFRLILLAAFLGIVFWMYKWRKQLGELATQRRIDAVMTKERNLLRTLVENIPDGIYIKDRESRKILANPADVKNLGCKSEAEVLGKSDFEIFPKELAEGFYADDQKVFQTGQPLIDREEYVNDEHGQKRWLLTTKVPLRDENNQITGLVGIGRDITDKKKAEEERKKAEAERERLITELQNALADVKLLSGLVPICANCKKIRDDQGYWTQIESYIQDRSDAKFSHSICPDCAQKMYPQYMTKLNEKKNPPKNEI
jgi:PAS domain S-box-containing protein